jgi:hypothetical protein
MTFERLAFPAFAALALTSAASPAQPPGSSTALTAPGYSFADLADLASNAPTVIDAQIRSAIRLKPTESTIPQGMARFYVEADARTLIRGAPGSPARFTYLADVPLDARGKPPKLKKMRVLLLARPVPGKPGSIQLVAPHAQIPWSQSADTQLRAILGELTAANAAPHITGVRSAFYVPGTVQGEGETQIFLQTVTGNPVSISVIRRPGEIARWSVALGEIVDEAAGAPRPGSLLWFRLACSLPAALPDRAIDPGDPANAAQARADYQVVRDGLGPCTRQKPAIQASSRPR